MGKSKKKSANSKQSKRKPEPQVGRRKFLVGSAGILIAGAIAGFWTYQSTKASNSDIQEGPFGPADLAKLPRHETRPTLPPGLFMGSVGTAYAAAKQIPAMLDQLYCYCKCKENFGHKSLLSCFVDRHAST
jgi:hypothetical protein